jgi:hypothetical protein
MLPMEKFRMTRATKPVPAPCNSIQPQFASETEHTPVRGKDHSSLRFQASSLQNLTGNEVRIEIVPTYRKQRRATHANRSYFRTCPPKQSELRRRACPPKHGALPRRACRRSMVACLRAGRLHSTEGIFGPGGSPLLEQGEAGLQSSGRAVPLKLGFSPGISICLR